MKQKIAAGLQVAGSLSLVVAGFVLSTVAGFVVAGVLGLVFGIALEVASPAVPSPAAEPAGEKPEPFGGDS
mgnify:CR=1 FL=1